MKNKTKIVIYLSLLLGIFLFPFSLNYKENIFNKIIENTSEPILENVTDKENLEYFLNKYPNSDIVARISIKNTSINEPVVQTTDNDFYLNHNLYKKKDKKGSTYLDYRVNSSSRKKLIFGHNSSTLEVPFKELEKYYDYDYFMEHQIIELEWKEKLEKYQIFSIFVETSNWNYMKVNFSNDESWYQHLISLKENSLYGTGTAINSTDEVLILQTCSHHKDYKKYNKKYLLIVAKKI